MCVYLVFRRGNRAMIGAFSTLEKAIEFFELGICQEVFPGLLANTEYEILRITVDV